MTTKTEKPQAIFIRVERSHEFLSINAYPCKVESDSYYGGERSPRAYMYGPLDDLYVSAQARLDSDEQPYWSAVVEYRPYHVNLHNCEQMIKTLRRVNRRMDELNRQLGYPQTFADVIARVGLILGAKSFGTHAKADNVCGSTFTWFDASMLATQLDRRIAEVREQAGVVA